MIRINPDLGYLTVAQEQEQRIEQSRRYHLLLAQADQDLRDLESDPARYSVAEFNLRRKAIIDWRSTLVKQHEGH